MVDPVKSLGEVDVGNVKWGLGTVGFFLDAAQGEDGGSGASVRPEAKLVGGEAGFQLSS